MLGTRLVEITPEASEVFSRMRDDRGRRIVVEWGEPDQEGLWTPSFTRVDDHWLEAEKTKAVVLFIEWFLLRHRQKGHG